MGFRRVVEVFPPVFPHAPKNMAAINISNEVEAFVEGVAGIRPHFDTVLVASLKRPGIARISTAEASFILNERLGINAAPVIVVRDYRRREFLSTMLTVAARGLRSLMLAWGDDGPRPSATLTDDYSTLSEAIADASSIFERAFVDMEILAPVDLRKLGAGAGLEKVKSRLRSGASMLLAQPPTVEPGRTYDADLTRVDKAGLNSKVLLGVFPFRSVDDVRQCEAQFGWRFPRSFDRLVSRGPSAVLEAELELVRRMRADRRPGVYLSTRGDMAIASAILG